MKWLPSIGGGKFVSAMRTVNGRLILKESRKIFITEPPLMFFFQRETLVSSAIDPLPGKEESPQIRRH